MKQTFATLEAPVLAAVIKERTPKAAISAIRNAEISGATAFDLHLSCLLKEYQNAESIKAIVECTSKPMLGLNYNLSLDCGFYKSTEEDRIALLIEAVKAGISAVDIQGYTFDLNSKEQYVGTADYSFTKGNPKEIVTDEITINKQIEFINKVHSMGAEVLLSCHPGIPMDCEQVVALAKFLEKRGSDVIKIVTKCENEEQAAEAFKTMITLKKEIKKARIHFHCNGKEGKITRLVNPLLGAYLTFCVDRYAPGHDNEQLHLKTTADVMNNIKKLM